MTETLTDVRERPLLAHRHEVRAALEGRLELVVRPLKPQPESDAYITGRHENGGWLWHEFLGDINPIFLECPFGRPGDMLWCKEGWKVVSDWYEMGESTQFFLRYRADAKEEWLEVPKSEREKYTNQLFSDIDNRDSRWRSPVQMPKWASRLTLEVTDVRVGQLEMISPSDALAAGAERWDNFRNLPDAAGSKPVCGPQGAFAQVWDSIYGKTFPWDSSPWVWLVGVRRAQP